MEDEDEIGDMDDMEFDGEDEDMDNMKMESKEDRIKREKEEREKDMERNKNEMEQGKTIFIRNLSFDTTEEQVAAKFEPYGKMKFCKLVRDKITDKPTGKAFIKYLSKSSADRVIEDGKRTTLYDPTKEEKSNSKSKDKKKKSEISISALLQGGIILDGRHLIIDRAVDHQTAHQYKQLNKDENVDKKNRNLLNIGKILPNSEDGKLLTDWDWKLRNDADLENNTKLKVNPNYFVSPTRLCIRNVPIHVTDSLLKQVCLKVLKQSNEKGKVVYSKIIVDKERVNSMGQPKSKGFAFIEADNHQTALTILHKLNNNNKLFYNPSNPKSKDQRLFVQFSVEDARSVRKQKDYLEKKKSNQLKQKMERKKMLDKIKQEGGSEESEETKKSSRGKKQREKKRLAKAQGLIDTTTSSKKRKSEQQQHQSDQPQQPKQKPLSQAAQEKLIKKSKEDAGLIKKKKSSDFDELANSYKRSVENDSQSNGGDSRPLKKKKWFE
eukprot:gene5177-6445_t